jgi:DNA-binding winged helix-turn-helix (wHTH) protein
VDRDLIRTVAGRGYQFTGEIRARSAGVPGAAPAETFSRSLRRTTRNGNADLAVATRAVSG